MESFIVSARKYRPMSFKSVVGQEHITTTLKNAIKNNQLAQAFLFCGPRGVGKTTCARILAKTINCTNPTEDMEACNECDSCRSFNASASFNVFELDAASNNSVDDIRELVKQVQIPPQGSRYKIYIIDEVHMLSTQAFNAFLKTLEEPPSYAKFILATTEKHKIIPTILSRCQIFDFKRIKSEDIAKHLEYVASQEGVTYEPEALHVIAQKAEGGLRDALSMFDQLVNFCERNLTYKSCIDNLNVLDSDYFFRFVDYFRAGDISNSLLLYQQIIEKGFDGQHFITGLAEHLRNLLVSLDPATTTLLEVSDNVRAKFAQQSQQCRLPLIIKYLEIASDAEYRYRDASNKRLFIEVTLMKLANLVNAHQQAIPQAPAQQQPKAPAPVQQQQPQAQPVQQAPKPQTPVQPQQPVQAQPQPQPQPQPQQPVQQPPAQPQQPQPQQPVQPQPQPTPVVKPAQVKIPTNAGTSLSINTQPQQNPAEEKKNEVITLSQEELEKQWMELAELKKLTNMEIFTTMNDKKLNFIDQENFEVEVSNSIYETRFKKYKNEILEALRYRTGIEDLNFTVKVVPLYDENEAKLFTTKDKYEAMSKENPALDSFRSSLFQDIDY
ncbi:MAG: DNA polymerase III subunit gamma/tau [Bacteroidales bacterium]|nr:DNA polymerase III subunit gamma/tau [Bacteroidales bacterium]